MSSTVHRLTITIKRTTDRDGAVRKARGPLFALTALVAAGAAVHLLRNGHSRAAPPPVETVEPPPPRPVEPVDERPPPESGSEPEPERRRRGPGLFVLLALLLAGGAAAAAYDLGTRSTEHTVTQTLVVPAPPQPAAPKPVVEHRAAVIHAVAHKAAVHKVAAHKAVAHKAVAHKAVAPGPALPRKAPKPNPAAKPKPAPKTATTAPPATSGFVPARTWTWAPHPGTSAYDVTVFVDGKVVLHRRAAQPRLVLPQSFRFRPGRYRWTVVALAAGPTQHPIVDSSFVMTRQTASAANAG